MKWIKACCPHLCCHHLGHFDRMDKSSIQNSFDVADTIADKTLPTAEIVEDVNPNFVATIAGQAVGAGVSHMGDVQNAELQSRESNTYNASVQNINSQAISSNNAMTSAATLGSEIGSIVPIVGSAVGAAIGTIAGAAETGSIAGGDLSSPEETSQI